jgi:hypothetical protein
MLINEVRKTKERMMTKTKFFTLLNRVAYPRKLGKSPTLNFFDFNGRTSVILTDIKSPGGCDALRIYTPQKGPFKAMDAKCDAAHAKFKSWLQEWKALRRNNASEILIQALVALCTCPGLSNPIEEKAADQVVDSVCHFYNLWRLNGAKAVIRAEIKKQVYKALNLKW